MTGNTPGMCACDRGSEGGLVRQTLEIATKSAEMRCRALFSSVRFELMADITSPLKESMPLPHGSFAYAGVEQELVEADAEVLTIYLLPLQEDGSPSQQRTVSHSLCSFASTWADSAILRFQYLRLPPPVTPYFLRISIDAGTAASKNGVLYTNFPLDGSLFERTKYHQTPSVGLLIASTPSEDAQNGSLHVRVDADSLRRTDCRKNSRNRSKLTFPCVIPSISAVCVADSEDDCR